MMNPSDAFVSTRASLMVNQTAAAVIKTSLRVFHLHFQSLILWILTILIKIPHCGYFMSNCFCSKWFDCTEYL